MTWDEVKWCTSGISELRNRFTLAFLIFTSKHHIPVCWTLYRTTSSHQTFFNCFRQQLEHFYFLNTDTSPSTTLAHYFRDIVDTLYKCMILAYLPYIVVIRQTAPTFYCITTSQAHEVNALICQSLTFRSHHGTTFHLVLMLFVSLH